MSLGTDAATTVQKHVATELMRLQREPGAHPSMLRLKAPLYECCVRDADNQEDLLIQWSVVADGFHRNVLQRSQKETIRRDGVQFPRSWLDPIKSLQVFDLVLKLSVSAPLRHNLDDQYKCVYLGAANSMLRDECIFNPFLWEEQIMSNLCVVVSWVHRLDSSQVHSRYYTDGIKDFNPPDNVLLGDHDEDEPFECTPEIENSQEREMIDYFLQAVDEVEPLVDLTQM